jgi:hypothetical protein
VQLCTACWAVPAARRRFAEGPCGAPHTCDVQPTTVSAPHRAALPHAAVWPPGAAPPARQCTLRQKAQVSSRPRPQHGMCLLRMSSAHMMHGRQQLLKATSRAHRCGAAAASGRPGTWGTACSGGMCDIVRPPAAAHHMLPMQASPWSQDQRKGGKSCSCRAELTAVPRHGRLAPAPSAQAPGSGRAVSTAP